MPVFDIALPENLANELEKDFFGGSPSVHNLARTRASSLKRWILRRLT
ncbi:hypothetical protein [Pseudorhodoplanes sp.]